MSDETVQVKTRVPARQRERWDEHAEELGISRSQFIREMVQAGRRGFEPDGREEPSSPDATPGVDGLEVRVQEVLRGSGALAWDELVEELTDDLEDRLEEALDSLQSSNRVRYSGRDGGYVLTDE